MRRAIRAAFAAGSALLAGLSVSVLAQDSAQDTAEPRPVLALMGTIPIYWGEADGLTEMLLPVQIAPDGDHDHANDQGHDHAPGRSHAHRQGHTHWARGVLEAQFALVPVSYLSAEALAAHTALLLAQPRALTAEENVALDGWVRAGGRVLLFADPMMTGESRFALGDRRRPQDVALLSPILTHWGLELLFDDEQQGGLRFLGEDGLGTDGGHFPVNLTGTWRSSNADCRLSHGDVVVTCRLGDGAAVLVADAAILDIDGPYPGAAEGLLALSAAFAGEVGEIAGNGAFAALAARETGGNPGISGAPPDARSGTGPP
ncbi:hypothetical protein [Altererythrobacter lauratis]|uniref:ABC transporter n=1 Tax=Alteraurantiacibacter lauratis TaxID=2054627 RepID=A0ABV7EKP7_9SPHN